MAQVLRKYFARSPRYSLNLTDVSEIEFLAEGAWKQKAHLLNVSLTGMALSAPSEEAPEVHQILKMQFHLPRYGQMACLGRIIRKDPFLKDTTVLLGVRFENLHFAQRLALRKGLRALFH